MESFLVFASVISLSLGHLCLLFPPQRGPMMDINKPGAKNCSYTTGPCGGMSPAHDAVVYPKNENITVTFMKNVNYFNNTGPGKFVISLLEPQGGNATVLATIPDNSEPSLSIYTTKMVPPTLPTGDRPHILQVVYQPNNSTAPAAEFYQCGDVGFGPK